MDILPTMEKLFENLPKDVTYDTSAFDANANLMRNRGGVDGESFYDVLVTAAQNTADSTSPQPDETSHYMAIAGQYNGEWSVYSKNGKYKYRTDLDQVFDLWADPTEKTEYAGADQSTIKNELSSEYTTHKNDYDNDRSLATQNKGAGDWHLCIAQLN
jgi:hypothetical protein